MKGKFKDSKIQDSRFKDSRFKDSGRGCSYFTVEGLKNQRWLPELSVQPDRPGR